MTFFLLQLFERGSTVNGKNFPVRVDPIEKGGRKEKAELQSLKVFPYT